jgi:hypothetical protein
MGIDQVCQIESYTNETNYFFDTMHVGLKPQQEKPEMWK